MSPNGSFGDEQPVSAANGPPPLARTQPGPGARAPNDLRCEACKERDAPIPTNSLVDGPAKILSLGANRPITIDQAATDVNSTPQAQARRAPWPTLVHARARSWRTYSRNCAAGDRSPRCAIRREPRTQPRPVVFAFRLCLANTAFSCGRAVERAARGSAPINYNGVREGARRLTMRPSAATRCWPAIGTEFRPGGKKGP